MNIKLEGMLFQINENREIIYINKYESYSIRKKYQF